MNSVNNELQFSVLSFQARHLQMVVMAPQHQIMAQGLRQRLESCLYKNRPGGISGGRQSILGQKGQRVVVGRVDAPSSVHGSGIK